MFILAKVNIHWDIPQTDLNCAMLKQSIIFLSDLSSLAYFLSNSIPGEMTIWTP